MTTTKTTKWTKTNANFSVEWYENSELPDILISHFIRFDNWTVIDQNGVNKGSYDSLEEAAGIAKHLA